MASVKDGHVMETTELVELQLPPPLRVRVNPNPNPSVLSAALDLELIGEQLPNYYMENGPNIFWQTWTYITEIGI